MVKGSYFGSICPCGCGTFTYLPISALDKPTTHPSWSFDGNLEAPTLSPSIFHHNADGPHWHGWLKGGWWTQA